MEQQDGPHASLRSLTANSPSGVLGLTLNKHGVSIQKSIPDNRQSGRVAVLPPLKLRTTAFSPPSDDSMETQPSRTQDEPQYEHHFQQTTGISSTALKGPTTHLVDACRTLLFATTSLHCTVHRCLVYCMGQDSLGLGPALQKSKAQADSLVRILDQLDAQGPRQTLTTQICMELVRAAGSLIAAFKELTSILQTRITTLTQVLDAKFARQLITTVHSASVDVKDAWETVQPFIKVFSSSHSSSLLCASPISNNATKTSPFLQTTLSAPTSHPSSVPPPLSLPASSASIVRERSHSDHTLASPAVSPLTSPQTDDDTLLYNHLKLAVTGSLHVVDLLKQSIQEAVSKEMSSTLEAKLYDLSRQADQAASMALKIDKGLENLSNNSTKEATREFWQDANSYLKVHEQKKMEKTRPLVTYSLLMSFQLFFPGHCVAYEFCALDIHSRGFHMVQTRQARVFARNACHSRGG